MYIPEIENPSRNSETIFNKLINNLPMGCLSSRSTVAPTNNSNDNNNNNKSFAAGNQGHSNSEPLKVNGATRPTVIAVDVGTKMTELDANDMNYDEADRGGGGAANSEPSQLDRKSLDANPLSKTRFVDEVAVDMDSPGGGKDMRVAIYSEENKELEMEEHEEANENSSSFDDESKMELYKQYVVIDYEITQLEDRDTLRVYHEKIEQLEQLERELDMITGEVEEAAARSDSVTEIQPERITEAQSSSGNGNGNRNATQTEQMVGEPTPANAESNSMLSGITSSISHKSLDNDNAKSKANRNNPNSNTKAVVLAANLPDGSSPKRESNGGGRPRNKLLAYSTVEEVFNRKIILEKERDKLKKEVELIIIECDKLQQRYKKRDEILDRLFDGRAGNGLENHLEQQLNWLMEQKHYVDQVFYAWKRAETLTSQTCEQFANAMELLKRLPKTQVQEQRDELAKTIGQLLIKSRQDMEQAQKYNPNVDAPFFTDNETEKFDKIIETISSNPISPSEYSQILTVIQFAHKRSVSIRLWLEQILQTTIARDSFELAEEYKWIAIQLRKERINIIKSRLQEQPYASVARNVLEQMMRQQIADRRQQREINRDSGVESEPNEWDIEEEIYRLLELNKARLQIQGSPEMTGSGPEKFMLPARGQREGKGPIVGESKQRRLENSQRSTFDRDQMIKDRIENRMLQSQQQEKRRGPSGGESNSIVSNTNSAFSTSSSKLRVELDEEARRRLLEQVGELHNKHKNRIELLRTSSKAKANSFIIDRRMARQQVEAMNGIAEAEGSS